MNVRYRVELSQAERGELTAMLSKGKRAARKLKRAHRTTPPPRSSCTCSHALRASIHSIVIQISITPQRVIDKSAASRRTRPNSESIGCMKTPNLGVHQTGRDHTRTTNP